VLQACLLDEDRRDQQRREVTCTDTGKGPAPAAAPIGTIPVDFLSKTPDPPPVSSLINACQHLLEIDAVEYVSGEDENMRVKLTPLGYHLSQLPMDAKIGKVLILGTILRCFEPALTVAAALSSTKSLFRNNNREEQKKIVEFGFGGRDWSGGRVKGDSIAAVAAYEKWRVHCSEHQRFSFAKDHGLDNNVMTDIDNLRKQFRDCMVDAGFLSREQRRRPEKGSEEELLSNNAKLVSCCLAAGLYPNVATLARPQRGKLGFKGGRLITKEGDSCTPSSQSFQAERVRQASETGKDAYAVYQSKNRILGTSTAGPSQRIMLDQVNFVSRFALLLFGGHHKIRDNALIVDGWLKFKLPGGKNAAILMTEFRKELDAVFLNQLSMTSKGDAIKSFASDDQSVIDLVIRLLEDE